MNGHPSMLESKSLATLLLIGAVGSCTPYGKIALVADRGRCREGLSENTSMPAPFCRPAHSVKAGDLCSEDDNCLSGLICNHGYTHGHCEVSHASAEHEPCEDDRNCSVGLLCNGSSTPPSRPGQCHQPGSL